MKTRSPAPTTTKPPAPSRRSRAARAAPGSGATRRSLYVRSITLAVGVLAAATAGRATGPAEDIRAVAALDTAYQAAVAKNDAATMDRILAEDFTLVTGRGRVFHKAELLRDARAGRESYEVQAEEAGTQTVRVWGDTAVVTALLRIKGARAGQPFAYRLWFSDTYVRTAAGWRYAFGQASLPLPVDAAK